MKNRPIILYYFSYKITQGNCFMERAFYKDVLGYVFLSDLSIINQQG